MTLDLKKLFAEDRVDAIEAEYKINPDLLNLKLDNDNNLCHMAASLGMLNILKWLEKNGVNPYGKDDDGITPLHRAAQSGHVELIKYLLSGARASERVNEVDQYGRTPLIHAARTGQLNVVEHLLQFKEVQTAIDHADNLQRTALIHASKQGHTAVANYLTNEYHADPLKQEKNGWNALVYAAAEAKLSTVQHWVGRYDGESKQENQLCLAVHTAARTAHEQSLLRKKAEETQPRHRKRAPYAAYEPVLQFLYYELARRGICSSLPIILIQTFRTKKVARVQQYQDQLTLMGEHLPSALALVVKAYDDVEKVEDNQDLYFNSDEVSRIASYSFALAELKRSTASIHSPLEKGIVPTLLQLQNLQFVCNHKEKIAELKLTESQINALLKSEKKLSLIDLLHFEYMDWHSKNNLTIAIINSWQAEIDEFHPTAPRSQSDYMPGIKPPVYPIDPPHRCQHYRSELAAIYKLQNKGLLITLPDNPIKKGNVPTDLELIQLEIIKLKGMHTLLQANLQGLQYKGCRLRNQQRGAELALVEADYSEQPIATTPSL